MNGFVHIGLPGRVVFGRGTVDTISAEAARLDMQRALVLSTPNRRMLAELAAEKLGSLHQGIFAGAQMHTPVEVTEEALQIVSDQRIDGIVAIGGGSTVGLGKAIALRTDLDQIAVPTTYAGSEMTPIIGQTEHGRKTTEHTLEVLPETVIYDVDLSSALPVGTSVTSGINAIAHAVEALYADEVSPIVAMMAETGVASLAGAIGILRESPRDPEARSNALYGAWLCGACLGMVGMALHHKLCHVLGGSFALPHAETHTIVLPHVLAYNARFVPDAVAALSRVLGTGEPATALYQLAVEAGVPVALSDIGMPDDGIEAALDTLLDTPFWNPRPLERDGLIKLLRRAFAGDRPMTQ